MSSVCCEILKFALGKNLVIWLVCYLLAHSYAFIVKVRCIVRVCVKFASHFEFLRMFDLFGRGWFLIEEIVALIGWIPFELSFGHYIILNKCGLFSHPVYLIPLVEFRSIWWGTLEFATNFQLSFSRLHLLSALHRTGDVSRLIRAIGSKLSLRKYEIRRGDNSGIGLHSILSEIVSLVAGGGLELAGS